MRGYLLRGSIAMAMLIGGANSVLAQDQTDQIYEEIVVTATKRAANIQGIASSVSQISGEDLETRGITDIENLAAMIPNLTFGKFGPNTFITIRGIGTTVDSGVAEAAVATYVDGIFLPRSTMAITRQVDLERVEVLRGPQGTLYGRNATGGAINFISRAPSTQLEGGATFGLEERDGRSLDAYISGPLGDNVAFRLSGGLAEQDGYVDVINTGEDLLNTDLWHARAALEITPIDSVSINLSAYREEDDGRNVVQTITSAPANVIGLTGLLGVPTSFTTSENEVFADGPFDGEIETTVIAAKLEWDINDSISFKSTTGYVDHFVDSAFDADATDFFFVNADAFPRDSESFSQEFNLFGESEKLSWLVGAYYFEEEYSLVLPVSLNGILVGAPVPSVTVDAGNIAEDTTSFAVFADVSYTLTDRLVLNAGLRFNSEEKDFDFFGAPSPVGTLDNDDLLPKLGLQYHLSDNVMVYGQWQQGIKSGGHQLDQPQTFEPEELDAFEIGVKSQFLNNTLTINAAAFFYDYADLQATTTIPPTTTLIESGDAEVFGFEGELIYAPSANLVFNLGISLLDSEYTDLTSSDQTLPGMPITDLSGEELIRAPDYTWNAGVEWNLPVNSSLLGNIRVRADVFRSAEYKLASFDFPATEQGAYTNIDLSVTFTDPSERFQVRAFVDNATDEVILNNGSFLATTAAFIGIHSEPRTAGVSFSAKF